MTERDLKALGFKRNDVTAEESGYPEDWYYYTYDLDKTLCLISSCNDEAKKEGWVKIWFSDDAARIPLNFQAEAPVGKMRVKLTEQSLKKVSGQDKPLPCVQQVGLSSVSAEANL